MIRALLRETVLRESLLQDGAIAENDCLLYDHLPQERREQIQAEVAEVLQGLASFHLVYSSPVDELPDDATVYGARGIYMVVNQDVREYFSQKRQAVRFADSLSRVSWSVFESVLPKE
jgi:hypothetical protein